MTEERGKGSEFVSWRSYQLFQQEVTRIARYIGSSESIKFRQNVALGAQSRACIIKTGSLFYRAQVDHNDMRIEEIDDVVPAPALPDRMMPLVDRASEGRVNPKGIPCLYMASHQEAAIAEVRPWIGSLVSVATLTTLRDQRVVDCTKGGSSSKIRLHGEPSPAEREEAVWGDIAMAFRKPVTRNEDVAEYAPTQILAEIFKNSGFDGVAYQSAFGADGYNVALFDPNAAKLRTCDLYEIADVSFRYKEAGNKYYAK